MKKILLLVLTASIYLNASAFLSEPEVYFTEFPLDKQVFPRDTITNEGTIRISGSVLHVNSYSAIAIKLLREDNLKNTYSQTLSYRNDSAIFSFNIPIKAELANYSVKVYGIKNNSLTLIKTAGLLLAGDAFIIQGQSNAESVMLEGSSNAEIQSTFIRVYGSGGGKWDKEWKIGDGDVGAIGNNKGNTGQWGLRLAKRLIDSSHIPMVVFNGAHGGKPISWFQKRGDSNNYAFLLKRVYESGFINDIHAIFWYQGESDSNPDNSIDIYKESFYDLYKDWKKDYKGFQRLYIVQINQSCLADLEATARIEEAHRQLAEEITGASLFSTNGIEHYGLGYCHYAYENGYKLIGDYLFSIVNRDFRALSNETNIESPQVTQILQTGNHQITLYFKNLQDTYVWEDGTEKDFVLNGIAAKVISGVVDGSTVVLTLNKNIKVDSLSFYGHVVGGSPCIRNISGEGMVGFYKFPVYTTPLFSKSNSTVSGFNSNVKVYPVPTHDFVTTEYNLPSNSSVFVSVTDVTGKKLLQIEDGIHPAGNNQTKINVSRLHRGMYFLQLHTKDFTLSIKFEKY